MKKAAYHKVFNPYWRYEEAVKTVKKGACASPDLWVRKLCGILKLRDKYRAKYKDSAQLYFEERNPLYASLLAVFEDTAAGGDKDLIEAALLSSPDVVEIAKRLKHPKFDSLFLGLYKTLFFDLSRLMGNQIAEFQCFILPMLKCTSNKIAIGNIWKLLALTGGLPLLMRKGLGTEPIGGEDINYLLQLAAFRHCSELLKYSAVGTELFKENPAAAGLLTTLSDMQSVRGRGRRTDWLAEIKDVVKNNINTLLSGSLKLLTAPAKDKLLSLTELDGQFNPQVVDTIEITKHITYTNSDNDEANNA